MYYYQSITSWENADLCDCPQYLEEVYGIKRKKPYDNDHEATPHQDY